MEMNQSFLIILLRPSEKQTLYWVIKPFFLHSFSSFDNYCKKNKHYENINSQQCRNV